MRAQNQRLRARPGEMMDGRSGAVGLLTDAQPSPERPRMQARRQGSRRLMRRANSPAGAGTATSQSWPGCCNSSAGKRLSGSGVEPLEAIFSRGEVELERSGECATEGRRRILAARFRRASGKRDFSAGRAPWAFEHFTGRLHFDEIETAQKITEDFELPAIPSGFPPPGWSSRDIGMLPSSLAGGGKSSRDC